MFLRELRGGHVLVALSVDQDLTLMPEKFIVPVKDSVKNNFPICR
jgi:hypothetical protein